MIQSLIAWLNGVQLPLAVDHSPALNRSFLFVLGHSWPTFSLFFYQSSSIQFNSVQFFLFPLLWAVFFCFTQRPKRQGGIPSYVNENLMLHCPQRCPQTARISQNRFHKIYAIHVQRLCSWQENWFSGPKSRATFLLVSYRSSRYYCTHFSRNTDDTFHYSVTGKWRPKYSQFQWVEIAHRLVLLHQPRHRGHQSRRRQPFKPHHIAHRGRLEDQICQERVILPWGDGLGHQKLIRLPALHRPVRHALTGGLGDLADRGAPPVHRDEVGVAERWTGTHGLDHLAEIAGVDGGHAGVARPEHGHGGTREPGLFEHPVECVLAVAVDDAGGKDSRAYQTVRIRAWNNAPSKLDEKTGQQRHRLSIFFKPHTNEFKVKSNDGDEIMKIRDSIRQKKKEKKKTKFI